MGFNVFSVVIPRHRVGAWRRPMTGSGGVSGIRRSQCSSAAFAMTGSSAFADDDNKE
jgi:hypothetical protein